jgi:hypothetical protein
MNSSLSYLSGPLLLCWAWQVNGRAAVLLLCLAAAVSVCKGLQSWEPSEAQRLLPADAWLLGRLEIIAVTGNAKADSEISTEISTIWPADEDKREMHVPHI